MKALVDFHLEELCRRWVVAHMDESLDLLDYIQPASIDLAVGDSVYLVKQKFLPFQQSVSYLADKLGVEAYGTKDGVTLFKGQTYLFPCLSVNLPHNLCAKVSPKSSIGRVDVLVRTVFDRSGFYDTVLQGKSWHLWLEVTPQSFNIRVQQWVALSQIMFFDMADMDVMDRRKSQWDIDFILYDNKPVRDPLMYDDNMVVALGLWEETIGWQARYTNEVIDLSKQWYYDIHRFFKPVHLHHHTNHKKVILEKDRFYILQTKEKIRVPKEYSVELVPFSHLVGELRVHYAGFFDPWFWQDTGACGVLEIRPHEDIVAYDGQPICLVHVYENKAVPHALYGERGNNYQMQSGPRLAKYFKR